MLDAATLHWILILTGLMIGAVFMAAFRYALREAAGCAGDSRELPRARLVAGGRLAHTEALRGRCKGRMLGAARLFQAGCVAFGITAVFFMFLCAAGMVAVALIGA